MPLHNTFRDTAPWKKRRSSSGFTLIELLVVVAIIMLLVSILIPSLKKAKRLAQKTHCMVNLRTHSTQAQTFAAAYGGILPASRYAVPTGGSIRRVGPFWEFNGSGSRSDLMEGFHFCMNTEYNAFWEFYQPLAESDGWICPAHPRADEAGRIRQDGDPTHIGDFGHWNGLDDDGNRSYYMLNENASSVWVPIDYAGNSIDKKLNLANIRYPGQLMQFVDRRDYISDIDQDRTSLYFTEYGPTVGSSTCQGSGPDDIGIHHEGGFNAAFVDAHVEYICMDPEQFPADSLESFILIDDKPLTPRNFVNR